MIKKFCLDQPRMILTFYTDTLRVSRGHVLHLFRQFTMHRESSRCRPISHTATQIEEFGGRDQGWKSGRIIEIIITLRELLLWKVERLRGTTPNAHRVLQKIGKYIHGDGAWPSNVSCRGDMPRRISIVSCSYANFEYYFLRWLGIYYYFQVWVDFDTVFFLYLNV